MRNYFRVGGGKDAPVFFFDGRIESSVAEAWRLATEMRDALGANRIVVWQRVIGGPWRDALTIGVVRDGGFTIREAA